MLFSHESRSFTKPWAPWRSRFWGRWQLADFAVFWRFSWKVHHLSEVGKPQAGCLKGDTGVWDDLWFHRYFHILMHWMRLWYCDMQVWHSWYPMENDLQIQLRFSDVIHQTLRLTVFHDVLLSRLPYIQDDQHKEAELGELKSLMSDDYFRAGLPEWRRRLSSEVLSLWILWGYHATNCWWTRLR